MAISENLFKSLLAMDSYNHGYSEGIIVPGDQSQLGTATFLDQSDTLPNQPGYNAGFYAIAYNWNGETVISYRGTDGGIPELIGTDFELALFGTDDGAQANLASEFYNKIKNDLDAETNITTTGHSLGGALAGFVAATHGLSATFLDNIGFTGASNNVYNAYQAYLSSIGTDAAGHDPGLYNPIYDTIYHGFTPQPLDFSGINMFYLPGTIAALVRNNTESSDHIIAEPLAPVLVETLSPVELHSQALDVIMKFAEENGFLTWGGSNGIDADRWATMARQLLPALFDDDIGRAAFYAEANQLGTGTPSWKLMNAVAYSVLDDGVMPFGDTAIRSLFDDANDISHIANQFQGSTSDPLVQAFTQIAVQYSGFLAKEASTDADALSGVITWDGTHLSANLSSDLGGGPWSSGLLVTQHIVGFENALAEALLPATFVPGVSAAATALQGIFGADTGAFISGFKSMIATDTASDTLDASAISGGALLEGAYSGDTTFVGGTGTNVMVGYGASNNFDLSVGNNIVLLGSAGAANLDSTNVVLPGAGDPPSNQWSLVEGTAPATGTSTGKDTFVFSSANTAPLTVVYGAGGSDTFDFESDGNDAQVYLLQMDDVNSQNFLSLDPSKISSYLDGIYSGNSYGGAVNKIVIINPTSDDILKYNGEIISDPTRYKTETQYGIGESSFFSDSAQLYSVGVDPSNPLKLMSDPSAQAAYFEDMWAKDELTLDWYGLKSNDTAFKMYEGANTNGADTSYQNSLFLTRLNNDAPAPYTEYDDYGGAQYSSGSDTQYYGADTGGLSLLGFNDGDFGINVAAANGNRIGDHRLHQTQSVTEWLEGDVDTSQAPIVVYGTAPKTFGGIVDNTDTTDDLVDNYGQILDTDAIAADQRTDLSIADFQRDAPPAPAAMSAASQRMSTASVEGPASTASAKSTAKDPAGRSTPPLWKSENERVAQLQQKGLDANGKSSGGFGVWGQGQSANDGKVPELASRLWNSLGTRQDAAEKSSSGWGALGAMPEAGIRLVSLLFNNDEIKLFADAIPGTNSYQMTDGTALLVSDAASAYRSFGSSAA